MKKIIKLLEDINDEDRVIEMALKKVDTLFFISSEEKSYKDFIIKLIQKLPRKFLKNVKIEESKESDSKYIILSYGKEKDNIKLRASNHRPVLGCEGCNFFFYYDDDDATIDQKMFLLNRKYKHILKEEGTINEIEDNFRAGLGKLAGKAIGGAVTGIARATGIPVIAGASDYIGNVANKAVNQYVNPNLLGKNKYFYDPEHNQYQTKNYNFHAPLPQNVFSPQETNSIKTAITPSFNKYGYAPKFVGKRPDNSLYYFTLHRGSDLVKDNRGNPMIYTIPYSQFNKMNNQTSDNLVGQSLKNWKL